MKFYRLSDATFYDCINNIYNLFKSFSDKKMPIFEEHGAFNNMFFGVFFSLFISDLVTVFL